MAYANELIMYIAGACYLREKGNLLLESTISVHFVVVVAAASVDDARVFFPSSLHVHLSRAFVTPFSHFATYR